MIAYVILGILFAYQAVGHEGFERATRQKPGRGCNSDDQQTCPPEYGGRQRDIYSIHGTRNHHVKGDPFEICKLKIFMAFHCI